MSTASSVVGFLVHPSSSVPCEAKADVVGRLNAKGSGLAKLVKLIPAPVFYNLVQPNIPLHSRLLRPGEVTGVKGKSGREVRAIFRAIPYSPQQIHRWEDRAVKACIEVGRYLSDEGATLVGLGSHTATIGQGGRRIAYGLTGVDDCPGLNDYGVDVTTGNSYTGISGAESLLKAACLVGHDPFELEAAVIGGGGSTGQVIARCLSKQVKKVWIVGRSDLSQAAARIGNVEQATMETACRRSTLIVTVTSEINYLDIKPEWLIPGAVICDVSRPRNTGEYLVKHRQDILIIDGSIIKAPGDDIKGWDFGFPPGRLFACMAETMILGLKGYQGNFSLGKELDFDACEQVARWAAEEGFEVDSCRAFDQPVSEEWFGRIREVANEQRRIAWLTSP